MELSKLIYPNMRAELLDYLDVIRKSRCQIDIGDFDHAIHFLFDDTSLSRNSSKNIGYFLVNKNESDAIEGLISTIDEVLRDVGNSADIKDCLKHPGWDEVIKGANAAHKLISIK